MPHTDGGVHASPAPDALAPHALGHALEPGGGIAVALALAVLAMVSLGAGAGLPMWASVRSRGFERHLALLIGFSAGLMLATALHDLLPHAVEAASSRAMGGVAAGFLTLYLVERVTHFHACRHRHCVDSGGDCSPGEPHEHEPHGASRHAHHHASHHAFQVPHAHGGGHSHGAHAGTHPEAHGTGKADSMALAGMSVHNFADGLTTAVAFGVSATAGLTVVLAIVLHQMAAGLSLGAIMLRAGRAPARVLWCALGSAAFIPLGVLFTHFVAPSGADAQGLILGVAAGSFLYVAACDLLPEAHAEDEGWAITAATLAGYAFTLLVRALSPHAH